jgi:AmmeMemoRadiSam system protein A
VTGDGVVLLRLARGAIEASFVDSKVQIPAEPWLQVPAGVFTTLRVRTDGALRGCVGSIEPRLPLGEAVVSAACAAAFNDGRFAPLTQAELDWVQLEVSVLSPLVRLPVADELDARRQLERTRPGVVLEYGRRRGVLLPKVWDSMEDSSEFLQQLKIKASLPASFWSADLQLHVFTTEDFSEANKATGDLEER